MYQRVIEGICSSGASSLFICEEIFCVEEEKDGDYSSAADKTKHFVYAKPVEKILPEDKFKYFQENIILFFLKSDQKMHFLGVHVAIRLKNI